MKVGKIVQLQKNEGTHSCIELRDKMNKYDEVTETKVFMIRFYFVLHLIQRMKNNDGKKEEKVGVMKSC